MKNRVINRAAHEMPACMTEMPGGQYAPFWPAAPLSVRAAAPAAARFLLAGALFAYFPLASAPLARGLTQARSALSALFWAGPAEMGGMETLYDDSGDAPEYLTGNLFLDAAVEGGAEPEGLSAAAPLSFFTYRLERGDIIGDLSIRYGLNQDTLISVNGIRNTRTIQAGKEIRIPNQDGVIHKTAPGETLTVIAEKYEVNAAPIAAANELFSTAVNVGLPLFVPGAKLNQADLQEINGDLFIRPVRGRITSRYGWRISPISGKRSFHSGMDIAAPQGTPVAAGMSGRVTAVAYSAVFGNYVILSHHSNYRTLYAHLHTTRVRVGAYVSTGQTVGTVGNTGQSTGPHLHFQVYKSGATVNPSTLMN